MAELATEMLVEERPHDLQPIAVAPLSDEMRQYKKRTVFLSAHRAELTRRYPDQWVGISSNWTLVAAPTVAGVIGKLEGKGLGKRGLAVKLMSTKPRRMIL